MGGLYLKFDDRGAAEDFMDTTPGYEFVAGGHVLEAVYGDDRIDGIDDHFGSHDLRVLPRRGFGGRPVVPRGHVEMPRPYPVIIGYDGMPAAQAGIAMKAEGGRWVPVSRFAPPLSAEDQARADARAESAYADRCAEYAVKGQVWP